MPIYHSALSGWISIKKRPCYEGLYQVKDAHNKVVTILYDGHGFDNKDGIVMTHWRGQYTVLEKTEFDALRQALDYFKFNRESSASLEAAGVAAIRLARHCAGPTEKYPRGRKHRACTFLRIAERLGAPMEGADSQYLESQWAGLSDRARHKITKSVSRFVGSLGALQASVVSSMQCD